MHQRGFIGETLRRQNLQRRMHRAERLHRLNSFRSWRARGGGTFRSLLSSFLYSDDSSTMHVRSTRLTLLTIGMFCASLAVVARLSSMQTNQHQKWLRLADRQHETSVKVNGARGTIYDSLGRPLAISVETLSVGVHPERIADRIQYAAALAPLVGVPAEQIVTRLEAGKNFVPIARGVSKEKFDALKKIKGIEIDREFRRTYPQDSLARQILGQVSLAGGGQSGIELRYNRDLQADTTTLKVNRDAKGRFLSGSGAENPFELYRASLEDPLPLREEGGDIQLTIDSVVQGILEEEFQEARVTAKAKRVFGMMLDADTGEIVAIGQSPALDGKEGAFLSPEELRNHPLQDSFEPGSTFKPIVAAIGMDRKVVHADEIIDCQMGRYVVGKHTIRDVHPVGVVPFDQVLVRSSNVGIAKVGARLGKERLDSALRQFGFGRQTGVELPGEGSGILHRLPTWKPIDTATTSFGQGISVTAIQMVRAYAALANGGYLVRPTLVRNGTPNPRERIISESVANKVAEILVGVTEGEHGTGKNAAIRGLSVAGKTGTAQKPRLGGRGYDSDRILASFIGFIDGSKLGVNRKLVMYVAVDEPGVFPRWGGTLAAPVFKKVMTRTLSHLLVQSDGGVRTAKKTSNRSMFS